jgi:hypothetical protein
MTKSPYFAGFFDGEGCIQIVETRRQKRWISWSVTASCSQRDPRPLRLLMEQYGGHIHHHPKIKGSDRWIFVWQISGSKAVAAIADMLPFLIVKKEQAEVALEFWDRYHLKPGRHNRVTEDGHEARRGYSARLKVLKEEISA